jgi:hypothetical protein
VIKTVIATVVVTSALALTACGSAGPSALTTKSKALLPVQSSKSDATGTWVQTYSDSVDLLELVDAKGVLSGSVTEVELPSSSESSALKTTNLSVVGTRAKQNLSLTINEGLGVVQTWTGSFSADQIELNIPQENGSLQTIHFARSTSADYTSDVNKLQARLDEAREAAQQQAVESARQDAEDSLSAGVATLKNDLAGLSAQAQLPAAVAAVTQALVGVTDARQVALGAQYGSCSAFDDDVSAVADAVSATGDAVSKGDDAVYAVTQAADTVDGDISDVQDLEAKFVEAGGQSDASINSVIVQAGQAHSVASAAATNADQQIKALYQKANDLYNDVDAAGNNCTP